MVCMQCALQKSCIHKDQKSKERKVLEWKALSFCPSENTMVSVKDVLSSEAPIVNSVNTIWWLLTQYSTFEVSPAPRAFLIEQKFILSIYRDLMNELYPGMVMHSYDSYTPKAEEGRPWVWGQPGLIGWPNLKEKKEICLFNFHLACNR